MQVNPLTSFDMLASYLQRADLAYPPPDSDIRKLLSRTSVPKGQQLHHDATAGELCVLYLIFFEELFKAVHHAVKKTMDRQKNHEALATEWRKYLSSEVRSSLYKLVAEVRYIFREKPLSC
jgi:hypothetical protein